MKKAMVLATVAAMLVALMAGTALAKGGGKGKGQRPDKVATYVFKGEVAGVGPDYVVVDVVKGNKKARAFAGESLSFAVNGATKIEVDGAEGASLSEIQPGMQANVQSKARADATEFVARKVSAESPEAEGEEPEAPESGE